MSGPTSSSDDGSQEIVCALFGFGRAGLIHFHNLRTNEKTRLKYIVDPLVDKTREMVRKYRLDIKVLPVEEESQVFDDLEVRAVFVSSPTYEHEKTILKSLKAGKSVFCEKPIAEDVEKTRQCYQAASKAGVHLHCSFNRRYDPAFREIYDKTRKDGYGAIYVIKTCSRDSPLPKMAYLEISGGIFHDCAVHDLDMVCWIMGQYPSHVHGFSAVHNSEIAEMGDVDTAVITLSFPSKALATIEISRYSTFGYDQRLEVFNVDGMMLAENWPKNRNVEYSKYGINKGIVDWSFPQRYADSYILSLEHFLDVLEDKSSPEITANQVINVSRLASACEESCRTGNTVQFTPE